MIHGLCGLPRSGSTLLGNVLAQNPSIYVSGSSPLVEIEVAISNVLSQAPDVVAELAGDPRAHERYRAAMAAFGDAYYERDRGPVAVLDKGRLWSNHAVLMRAIYPNSVIIVTVRDPRDVVASIERQHRKTGIFRSHTGAIDVGTLAQQVMAPNGSVGLFVQGIEDLLRRDLPNVVYVRFESFLAQPQGVIDKVYARLGLPEFEHQFVDVVNVAPDVDAVYRHKFPHDGSGTISAERAGTWKGTIPPGLADQIAAAYPMFMQRFGYR